MSEFGECTQQWLYNAFSCKELMWVNWCLDAIIEQQARQWSFQWCILRVTCGRGKIFSIPCEIQVRYWVNQFYFWTWSTVYYMIIAWQLWEGNDLDWNPSLSSYLQSDRMITVLPVFLHAYLDVLWGSMCCSSLVYESLICLVSK